MFLPFSCASTLADLGGYGQAVPLRHLRPPVPLSNLSFQTEPNFPLCALPRRADFAI